MSPAALATVSKPAEPRAYGMRTCQAVAGCGREAAVGERGGPIEHMTTIRWRFTEPRSVIGAIERYHRALNACNL